MTDAANTSAWLNPATVISALGTVPAVGTVIWLGWEKLFGTKTDNRKQDLADRQQLVFERESITNLMRTDNKELRDAIKSLEGENKELRADRDMGWNKFRTAYQMLREYRHGWANAAMAPPMSSKLPPDRVPKPEDIEGTSPDEFGDGTMKL